MGTVDKFGIARLLDPANGQFSGQQRVNAELFSAIEILGRKLERSEAERDRLTRRLALIESAATVDEKTGKLYLPAVMEPSALPRAAEHTASKWIVSTALMSSTIALLSLFLVLFHEPPPALTKEQVALLDTLKGPQFSLTSVESGAWKHPEAVAQMPDSAELLKHEQVAEVPKPAAPLPAVNAPVVAEVPPQPQPQPAEVKVADVKPQPAASVVKSDSPQDAFIPGEDKLAGKAVVKDSAQKPGTQVAGNDTSSPEIPQEMTPDTALPAKLAQLESRAFHGIPEAQHDIATLYASGKLVAQNYPRAIYWFNKSAEGGVANANYNLGVIYQQGLGVGADMPKAISWYEKAAELGHPEAMYNLGIAYVEGIGTKVSIEKGVSYFKRAANAGVTQAAYNLGVLYESSFIGPVDMGKAQEWYKVAAAGGHAEARAAVTRLGGPADQALTLAETVEPAAGGASAVDNAPPLDENNRAIAPKFNSGVLAKVQQELIHQGLLAGKTDGVMNPQTADAIRAYQRKLGLQEDGEASQVLLDKMEQSASAASNR